MTWEMAGNKMSSKLLLKKIIARVFLYTGVTIFFRAIHKNKNPIILMYHKVDKDKFDTQMRYLKKNYNVISLYELISTLKSNHTFAKNTAVITFDDGYLDNYRNAYPILKKYGLPATIFVVSGLIGTKKFAWWDKISHSVLESNKHKLVFVFDRKFIHLDLNTKQKKLEDISFLHKFFSKYTSKKRDKAVAKLCNLLDIQGYGNKSANLLFMNWEQLKEMSRNNIEMGSHTVSHPFLSNIPSREMFLELNDSKNMIEKKLKMKVNSFCYPSGDMNIDSRVMVKEVGYASACSIRTGIVSRKSDIFALERVGINIQDDLPIFAMKTTKLWMLITSRIRQDYHET